MKRAVIFDFDGTIADSLPAVIEVFEQLTGRAEHYSSDDVKKYRHLSLVELMYELKVPKWKVPLLMLRGRKMLHAHMLEIAVHPGIAEVIQELHERGERLYILSSNSKENVSQYLRHYGLSSYFTKIYGGASVLGKAPRLNKLISTEAVDVTTSWYIGDETRDIIAAHAVGLHIASVSWGYNSREALVLKQPEMLVDTPKELLQSLEKQWKK